MRYVFYITNHGFGHASRNVPIIKQLSEIDRKAEFLIKSDQVRCDFLKRNFLKERKQITYYTDCEEVGLILKPGKMIPDIDATAKAVRSDLLRWDDYVIREVRFLKEVNPDVVIVDIVCWALQAAKICGISSLLISNFTWAQMYRAFYEEDIWKPFEENYSLADKALWYEFHDERLHRYCCDYDTVSLVSRIVDYNEVERIKEEHEQPIVFVSLGASAEIRRAVDVSGLPYDFLVTRGVALRGDNVYMLPVDMINTPDYIAASDYVVAKGGWSTVAELMLQRKCAALLCRGQNPEDEVIKRALLEQNQCIAIDEDSFSDIDKILGMLDKLKPASFSRYRSDVEKICQVIGYLATGDRRI